MKLSQFTEKEIKDVQNIIKSKIETYVKDSNTLDDAIKGLKADGEDLYAASCQARLEAYAAIIETYKAQLTLLNKELEKRVKVEPKKQGYWIYVSIA